MPTVAAVSTTLASRTPATVADRPRQPALRSATTTASRRPSPAAGLFAGVHAWWDELRSNLHAAPPVQKLDCDPVALTDVLDRCTQAGILDRCRAVVTAEPTATARGAARPVASWRPAMSRFDADAFIAGSDLRDDYYHTTSNQAAHSIGHGGFEPRLAARELRAGYGVYLCDNRYDADNMRCLVKQGPHTVLTIKVNARNVGRIRDQEAWTSILGALTTETRTVAKERGLSEEARLVLQNQAAAELLAGRLGFEAVILDYATTRNLIVFDPRRVTVVEHN